MSSYSPPPQKTTTPPPQTPYRPGDKYHPHLDSATRKDWSSQANRLIAERNQGLLSRILWYIPSKIREWVAWALARRTTRRRITYNEAEKEILKFKGDTEFFQYHNGHQYFIF